MFLEKCLEQALGFVIPKGLSVALQSCRQTDSSQPGNGWFPTDKPPVCYRQTGSQSVHDWSCQLEVEELAEFGD